MGNLNPERAARASAFQSEDVLLRGFLQALVAFKLGYGFT
jgi:hypothetical protein